LSVPTAPFARGSVSLRLYPHNDQPATRIVSELRGQAALGAEHGFDGVMTAEHHGGFAGYLPNPLQVAGWCLEAMGSGWAAPCPLLLPLRPPAMVAEEIAWLAARFPGRVGLGVASGALPADFDIMGQTMDDLAGRFAAGLETVAAMLSGRDGGALAGDPAIAACVTDPVPLMSAAMGFTAVRRAARVGAGILFDSLSAPERCRELIDAYREAGGTAPAVLIRRAWVGEPPRDHVDAQVDVYRSYASSAAMEHWKGDQYVGEHEPKAVVETLLDVVARTGADALNLRVHVPGVTPELAREQIVRLGSEVLPPLHKALADRNGNGRAKGRRKA
jgi:alkanesulfonate monooxygenase SsuD/methylene tetrahydromethanopterin reductase-like flavin-dependent oxidoreductase (luciferase family)